MTPNAVELSDPPTGSPWKTPDTRLALPWAIRSRRRLRRLPSGLGTVWLTPTPWTRTTRATDRAPVIMPGVRSRSAGRLGKGSPRGISPRSRTIRTLPSGASATTAEGTAIATRRPSEPSRVRGSTRASASVSAAIPAVGRSMAPACRMRSAVWVTRFAPSVS